MDENRKTYRQIAMATSLFGGVQAFQIIITVIKSKFVAILLGPFGIGVVGLLTSTVELISNFTNFGLSTSAVKDISEANATQDKKRISTVITVMRKLVWITGMLGAVITLVFSQVLSQIAFGNKEYTIAFVWLSVTLLLNQLSSGQLVLLQGLRRLKDLAKASMLGSLIGLLTTVPIYYILGIKGIVPVIIITSVTSLLLSWYYSRKVETQKIKTNRKLIVSEGRGMMTMGFMISITGILGLSFSYLVRIFITRTGDVTETGFYIAGFAIINTYSEMIFSAFDADYYPRLSAIAKDNILAKLTINQQSEIAILILAPFLALFLVFVKWAIIILYSRDFLNIYSMLQWATIGVFFRTISWATTILLLAKAEGKIYFWNELIGNSYTFIFTILGYYYWGLTGIGITYMLSYFIYTLQIVILTNKKYKFSFTNSFVKIFITSLTLAIICFVLINLVSEPYNYIVSIPFLCASFWYSYRKLNHLIGISELIQNFRQNHSKNKKS